ncbi:proline--tRNA ligase, cytoplasmic [Tanacetum coccineum]
MYPQFSKWIRGHRNLPLKVNQWCNVVRWEFKNPTPLIRNREFIWQEGHTAFATRDEADTEVLEILELYRRLYEDYLAVPVVKEKKSENEKFAGALYTTSIECFELKDSTKVTGTTYHAGEDGDDTITSDVVEVQVIVVHVPYKDANLKEITDACLDTVKSLHDADIHVEEDLRENYSPGWKYSHWELKGVPLRIEIGPKDLANKQVHAVLRDNGSKVDIPMDDLVNRVKAMLDDIQQSTFDVAKEKRDACIQEIELEVKAKTKAEIGAAKTLCSPLDQPEMPEDIIRG